MESVAAAPFFLCFLSGFPGDCFPSTYRDIIMDNNHNVRDVFKINAVVLPLLRFFRRKTKIFFLECGKIGASSAKNCTVRHRGMCVTY